MQSSNKNIHRITKSAEYLLKLKKPVLQSLWKTVTAEALDFLQLEAGCLKLRGHDGKSCASQQGSMTLGLAASLQLAHGWTQEEEVGGAWLVKAFIGQIQAMGYSL